MKTKTILAIAGIFIVLGAGFALARPTGDSFWNNMMGGNWFGNNMMGGNGNNMMGNGMMGGNGPGNNMMSNGIMGGSGPGNTMMSNGMMGGNGPENNMMGNAMMGGNDVCGGYAGNDNEAKGTPITIEKAKEAAEQYLVSTGNTDLALSEVIEFDNNFYAGVKEKSTDMNAFELLVNKYTGKVFPEVGPNMMWNTKYGHMNTQDQGTVTKERALEKAQAYLEKTIPGSKVGDVDAFYGYYTIEVTKDDKIYGMLSVNANTGAIWYHTWHGNFVKF